MKKYSIGFVRVIKREINNDVVEHVIASCGCGTIKLLGEARGYHGGVDNHHPTCDCCGNIKFVKMKKNEKRVLYPYIEVIEKSRKGFKVKRTNLSVFHDDFYNVAVKENMIQELSYDLVDKEIKLVKNGEEIDISSFHIRDDALMRFFTNVNHSEFKKLVSTEETENLYDFAWSELSRNKNGRYSDRKFYIGMTSLFKYGYMQILANAGFPNIKRFYENNYYSYRNGTVNTNGTNPKDILGLPKFIIPYFRENADAGMFEIKQVKKALEKVDGNRFREILEIVKDESTLKELCNSIENLIEIHDTYGYNNVKKLTLYLFRETRINQGITNPSTSATLLRDYIRMSTKLGYEFEKYPKSLKKEHDIAQMNYKVQEDSIKRKEFEETIKQDDYKSLEYKKGEYTVITPRQTEDLIKEGNELSHCVASYVNDVVAKRCKIFFLRKTDMPELPLATIEIRGENVRQARGYANRSLTAVEKAFVSDWADKKKLQLNYY